MSIGEIVEMELNEIKLWVLHLEFRNYVLNSYLNAIGFNAKSTVELCALYTF